MSNRRQKLQANPTRDGKAYERSVYDPALNYVEIVEVEG